MPTAAAHQEALASARAALREIPVYAQVTSAVGAEHAEVVSMLLLATVDRLMPAQRSMLTELTGTPPDDSPLAAELTNLRAQLAALWDLAREERRGGAGGG